MTRKPTDLSQYAKEPIGRPSKFTEKRRNDIIDAISHRIPYEMAAEANGINVETLYDWLRTAKKHRDEGIDSEYTQFSEALKKGEMTRVREHTDMIAAKPERWQADAWLLERRWHKHFSANAALGELNSKLDQLLDGEPKRENGNEGRNEENGKKD